MLLPLMGLVPAPGAKVELREVWRVGDMPHYKDPEHKDMVKVYQEAFRVWGYNMRAAIASVEQGGKAEAEELMWRRSLS
jgi:hypothetical protein